MKIFNEVLIICKIIIRRRVWVGSTRGDGALGKTIVWHPIPPPPLLLTSRLSGGSGGTFEMYRSQNRF